MSNNKIKNCVSIIYENKISKKSLIHLNESVKTQGFIGEFTKKALSTYYKLYAEKCKETGTIYNSVALLGTSTPFSQYVLRTSQQAEGEYKKTEEYKFLSHIGRKGILVTVKPKSDEDYYVGGFTHQNNGEIMINITIKNDTDAKFMASDINRGMPYDKSFLKKKYLSVFYHELQHAWDYIISNDKFGSGKDSKKYADEFGTVNPNSLSDDEREKMYKKYYNLEFEVNARLTETLIKLQDHFETRADIKEFPKDEFMRMFQDHFKGYDMLEDDVKVKVDRRAIKFFNHLYEEATRDDRPKIEKLRARKIEKELEKKEREKQQKGTM